MKRALLLLAATGWLALSPARLPAQTLGKFLSIMAGEAAPDYFAATLQGDTVRLREMRGRAVLLNVWATWCGPCQAELPQLERLHQEFAGRGLVVLGVSVDHTNNRSIQSFLNRKRVTYPVARDTEARLFGTFGFRRAVPQTLLIGPDGVILSYWAGAIGNEREKRIREMLEEALPAGAGADQAPGPKR